VSLTTKISHIYPKTKSHWQYL